jgi:hypothetical protein
VDPAVDLDLAVVWLKRRREATMATAAMGATADADVRRRSAPAADRRSIAIV